MNLHDLYANKQSVNPQDDLGILKLAQTSGELQADANKCIILRSKLEGILKPMISPPVGDAVDVDSLVDLSPREVQDIAIAPNSVYSLILTGYIKKSEIAKIQPILKSYVSVIRRYNDLAEKLTQSRINFKRLIKQETQELRSNSLINSRQRMAIPAKDDPYVIVEVEGARSLQLVNPAAKSGDATYVGHPKGGGWTSAGIAIFLATQALCTKFGFPPLSIKYQNNNTGDFLCRNEDYSVVLRAVSIGQLSAEKSYQIIFNKKLYTLDFKSAAPTFSFDQIKVINQIIKAEQNATSNQHN